jgi:hypothetical protein
LAEPTPGTAADIVDASILALAEMVDDLRHSDRLWAAMDLAEAAAWRERWVQLMTVDVPRLERSFTGNKLTPTQRRHYQRLRHTMQRYWSTIDGLELRRPPIPRD